MREVLLLRRADEPLRLDDVRPAELERPDALRLEVLRPEVLRPVVLRAVVLRAVLRPDVLRADVLRPVVLRPVVLRPVVLRPVVLRPVVLRAVVLRAVLRPVVPPPVFFAAVLRADVLRPLVLRPALPDALRADARPPARPSVFAALVTVLRFAVVLRPDVLPPVFFAAVLRPDVLRPLVLRLVVLRDVERPVVLRPDVLRPEVLRPDVLRPEVERLDVELLRVERRVPPELRGFFVSAIQVSPFSGRTSPPGVYRIEMFDSVRNDPACIGRHVCAHRPRRTSCVHVIDAAHQRFLRSTARSSCAFVIFERPSTFRLFASLYNCSRVRPFARSVPERNPPRRPDEMSSRERRDDSFASPARARSLFTVRAAISSALSSDAPWSR